MTESLPMTALTIAPDVRSHVASGWRWAASEKMTARVVDIASGFADADEMEVMSTNLYPNLQKNRKEVNIRSVRREYRKRYGLDPMTWLLIARIVIALIRWWKSRGTNQETWARFVSAR